MRHLNTIKIILFSKELSADLLKTAIRFNIHDVLEYPVKEKDLKNHLESRPLRESKQKDNSKENDALEDISQPQSLLLEKIEKDNQVMRALEILVGYDIFQSLKL